MLWIPATFAFAYLLTGLPTFYWLYVGRVRRPPPTPAPPGLRVTMITLCVPSHESLEVIERQLHALVEVEYPHDSWVLDEGADPDVERLARALGVRYFTRKGVERWNQPGPPFQAKTLYDIYQAHIDPIVARTNNDAYDEAAELVRTIKKLMERTGKTKEFAAWLGALRTKHKAKRNFMQRLERLAAASS